MAHKWKIVGRKDGQFGVQFVYNAEVIFWSESYTGRAGAENCVASAKKNAPGAATVDLAKGEDGKGYRFEIAAAKNGQPFVRFVAANGETMLRTETYAAMASARNAVASLQKNGPGADLVDETKA